MVACILDIAILLNVLFRNIFFVIKRCNIMEYKILHEWNTLSILTILSWNYNNNLELLCMLLISTRLKCNIAANILSQKDWFKTSDLKH